MKIAHWFKGPITCPGVSQPLAVEGSHADTSAQCLYTAADAACIDMGPLASVAERLFGGRCLCNVGAITRLIHINNHPETSREDVNKILRVYTEEVEDRQ